MIGITVKLLTVFVVVILGWLVFAKSDELSPREVNDESSILQQEDNEDKTGANSTKGVSYTLSEVAEHDTASDCWTVIDGLVYDLTEFIPGHPGGPPILRACGVDGTKAFDNLGYTDEETVVIRQMNDLSEDDDLHSPNAMSLRATLQIGTLKSGQ